MDRLPISLKVSSSLKLVIHLQLPHPAQQFNVATIHGPRSTPSRCADIQHSTTKPGTGVKRFRNLLL
ncbi:unnamed protein product [[Candida] boidinii]|nr:unnamed protein product [[Candida] boidinii]